MDTDLGEIFENIEIEADHSTQPTTATQSEDNDEPVQTEPVAEGADSPEEVEGTDTQDKTKIETNEPSKGTEEADAEGTETKTETEIDWKSTLPPAPQPYAGKVPEINEDGEITNMTHEEYQQYSKEIIKAELRLEGYGEYVENVALDAAEKILPEIKTNPLIRTLVQNIRVASVINGDPIDSYEAAKQVREALGIAPEKLSEAKAEGVANTKASITIQKNAALETGSGQTAPEKDKVNDLQKRISRGDDDAFAELLDIWDETGKL